MIVIFFSFFLVLNSLAADQIQSVPNPAKLERHWWKFYVTDNPNDLNSKILQSRMALEDLKKSLSEKEHEKLKQLIERIELNLIIYKEVNQLKPLKSDLKVQYLKSYTLEQIFQISQSLRDINLKKQSLQLDLIHLNDEIEMTTANVDRILTLYFNLPESTFEKLNSGLHLMSYKIQLEILKEKKAQAKQSLENLERTQQSLKSEIEYAETHVKLNEKNLKDFKAELEKFKGEKKQKQNELLLVENKALTKLTNNDDPASIDLWEQRLTQKKVDFALCETKVLVSKMKCQLAQFLQNEPGKDKELIEEKLSKWDEEIDNLSSEADRWDKSTEKKQEELGVQYAQIANSEELNTDSFVVIYKDIFGSIQGTNANLKTLYSKLNEARYLVGLSDEYLMDSLPFYEGWFSGVENIFVKTAKDTYDYMHVTLFKIQDVPVTFFTLLRAIFIIIAAWIISRVFSRFLFQDKRASKLFAKSTQYVLKRLVHYTLIILGVLLALSTLGLNITNFIIVLGALGVGIGFGLQSVVNNLVSGILILLGRNISINDFIEVEKGILGRVLDINLQNTLIKTFDGIDMIIPNSQLISDTVVNWTKDDPYCRLRISFGVAYGSDKELVQKVVVEAAKKQPFTVYNNPIYLDPQVWLVNFGDSSLDFQLVVWVNFRTSFSRSSMTAALLWEIETALKENGITIPFPQRDLYIKEFQGGKS